MSTKALREALKELGYHATTDCQSAAGAEETQSKLDAAVEELAEIERVAKVWAFEHPDYEPQAHEDEGILFASIARDAP